MPAPIRFLFVLHNHQPVGNFDSVFEQAYQDAYLPFLDLFESYSELKLALHTSGSLMEWLDAHHREYLDRVAALVDAGRVEIVGGAFYEPILSMIPSRDRIGQISSYRAWLEDRFNAKIRGMWIPERVWEQSMAADIVQAGAEYAILDDAHFKASGLTDDQLFGYYLTEHESKLLRILPGSERLRYEIPFASPHAAIDTMRAVAQRQENAVAVFADDGEKFGSWPGTKGPVYEEGWLRQFFDLVLANRDWITPTTPSETIDNVLPLGNVYIPEGSYREMNEWVLPPQQLMAYEDARHELQANHAWSTTSQFVHGGFWRNFLIRYPESNEMYARMMSISSRLAQATASGDSTLEPTFTNGRASELRGQLLREARTELYRGQCNCPYWHGAFGGIYLPHLRNAIYEHLIAAENLLDRAQGRQGAWVEAASDDFNLDGRPDVRLASDRLVALVTPSRGGQLYELDVRDIRRNLLATLSRREEAYHRRVLAGPGAAGGSVIDDASPVKFKQPGLDRRLQYDRCLRKSLLDHFYDEDVSPEALERCDAAERGDFLTGPFEARLRRNPGRVQVQLSRSGNAWGIPLRITKGITLEAGSPTLEIAYVLEGLPRDRTLHFSVELNFAGLPAGANDRYFLSSDHTRLGQLGTRLNLADARALHLVDQWLGLDVGLTFNRPTGLWTYPIETISQSEGGFELVHQSVCVQPHWLVQGDKDGCWSMTLHMTLDTSMAQGSQSPAAERTVAVRL